MNKKFEKIKDLKKTKFPRWLRIILRGFGILLLIQIIISVGIIIYVKTHEAKVLAIVTEKLNENLSGTMTIESMEPTFFTSFPRVSLHLKNVLIRDKEFKIHHKTFLKASDFDIAINVIAFIRGTIEIGKISISNAAINMFTDSNGYSNTDIFKKNPNKQKSTDGDYPELKNYHLSNVSLTIDNQQKKKLFDFVISDLDGKMRYSKGDWTTSLSLKTLAKSMAFSTSKGSFIKDKKVEGDFEIRYVSDQKTIFIMPNPLQIGDEDFTVSAEFKTEGKTADYGIHIVNDKILWENASHLLSPNITSRLDLFNLKNSIAVRCDINGDFNIIGDPLIIVKTTIMNNELESPGGLITECSFKGIFTNNYKKENGNNDKNSAVILTDFHGLYSGLPVNLNKAEILDFENPYARGNFKSNFNLDKLESIIAPSLLKFTNGNANVNLDFVADIVNYKITKPIVTGTVDVKDGNLEYIPRRIKFSKTSVTLNFKNNDLLINNIHLESGKSIVKMEGKIRNFLNVYYEAPEKVVVDWKINSPQIALSEFLGYFGSRSTSKSPKRISKSKNADFTDEINLLFEKSKVNMELRIAKLYYNKFIASNVRADLNLNESGILIKNGNLNNSGGKILFNGNVLQKGQVNAYKLNATVQHVNVSRFLDAFDNFGITSMTSENLKGILSANAGITGRITDEGKILPKSIVGKVDFELSKGALLNFDPVRNIGKYAFPFRDMNSILFEDLQGNFAIQGEKVYLSPMQINSSVLNMDINGLYSFGKGTNIAVSVPLRDPKRDKDITDKAELAKRREKGIVIRLLASDDKDGKVKISLIGKKKQLETRDKRRRSVN